MKRLTTKLHWNTLWYTHELSPRDIQNSSRPDQQDTGTRSCKHSKQTLQVSLSPAQLAGVYPISVSFLSSLYLLPSLITPIKTLDGRWKKNDPKDAYNIVDLISQNKCFFYQQDDYYESLRCLVSLRNRLSKELSSIKIRLRNNHLAKYFPEMDALYKDILHHEALSVFQNFPTANDIVSTSFDKFRESLNYRHSSVKAINRIKHLWDLANDSIGCQRSLSCNLNLQLLLEDAQRVQLRIKRINHEIEHQCSSLKDYSLLQTIPGYGPWVAACFIAYFGNIDNYDHPKQLTKYAGIDLEYSQSGKFHSRAMISKKGNTILRYAICTATLRSMRNPFIRSYCQKKLLSKGETSVTKAKLRIKLADKFLRVAFVILKKKIPFDIQLFVDPVIN